MVALSASKVARIQRLATSLGLQVTDLKGAKQVSKRINMIGKLLDDADDCLYGEYEEALYE